MIDVLHIPFEYFPDPCGGTEIYVAALCRELRSHGLVSAVAAPAPEDSTYLVADTPVYRYQIPDGLVGRVNPPAISRLAKSFAAMLDTVRPRLVHLHALSPGIGAACINVIVERNLPFLLTYHTPTLSCARGTMMAFGQSVCDGRYRSIRCTACVGQKLTKSLWKGALLGLVPAGLSRHASASISGPVGTALGIKAATERWHLQFESILGHANRVVAVCDWVRATLLAQGAPAERVVLSRQGLPHVGAVESVALTDGSAGLRLCFLGRLDPTKGIELLLEAFSLAASAPLTLDLYGVPSSPAYKEFLLRRVRADPRIRLLAPIASSEVIRTIQSYDAIVVPSQWLETGPLVVLEAHAAGRPVIGSRLGGIAELVRDGIDGWLLPPTDPAAWGSLFVALSQDRRELLEKATRIRSPRTMADAAADMAQLYGEVWAEHEIRSGSNRGWP